MKPPYYAVIFTSKTATPVAHDYQKMADKMIQLAHEQEGFLGVESVRDEIGITVSYWSSLAAIALWKHQIDHLDAQKKGREKWYAYYRVRIALVEKDYAFERD